MIPWRRPSDLMDLMDLTDPWEASHGRTMDTIRRQKRTGLEALK